MQKQRLALALRKVFSSGSSEYTGAANSMNNDIEEYPETREDSFSMGPELVDNSIIGLQPLDHRDIIDMGPAKVETSASEPSNLWKLHCRKNQSWREREEEMDHSQDLNQNCSISEALTYEDRFFHDHPVYHGLSNCCGVPQLAKKLNQILEHHIRMVLPSLKDELNFHMIVVVKELQTYGEVVESKVEQGAVLLNILKKIL